MIIKELQIQNFGRHREINFKCDAPVVGLLGPNGVGKSTVLDAIEFAITGEARDPLPSYVRHGEGNASVSLTFIKNGMEGYIFRQFGKTPKRKLVWDGKTITAAKEVDNTMARIFGADKQAIANAVFINQGALDKILFSGEAEQRSLFIRLVNMGFCEQIANMVDGKIRKVQTTVVDLGPALDAAILRVQESDKARVEQQNAYALLPDYSEAWHYCDWFIRNEDQLRQVLAQLGSIENQKATLQNQLTNILEMERAATYPDLQTDMIRREHEVSQEQVELEGWRSIKAELMHYRRLSIEISADAQQLREAQERRKNLNPEQLTLEQLDAKIAELNGRIQTEMERRRLATQLAGTKEALRLAEKLYQDRPIARESWAGLSARQAMISQTEQSIKTLDTFLNKQREFAECAQMKIRRPDGLVQCTQCGLVIANPEALSPESLAQMEQTIAQMRSQLETQRSEYQALKTEWESCDQAAKRLGASVFNLQNDRDQQFRKLAQYVECDISQDEVQYRTLSEARAVIPELDRTINQLTKDIGQRVTDRTRYTRAIANQDRAQMFTDAEETRRSKQLSERQERLNPSRHRYTEASRIYGMLGSLETQAQSQLTAKEKLTRELEAPMPATVSELSATLDGNLTAVRAELQARNEARANAYGRLTQAVEAANAAVAAHQELTRRMEADAQKRVLLEDLAILRDTLKPNGLPMAVVQYHFSHLAALTQEALNQLDANFSIQIDDAHPLSFKFSRLDEPEHEPLPMNKLSGGQRVRLCTAFLIAVQQRLVREVGLLVLDEPSTHIDQTGVDSLAEMLRTLGSQLRNTETQIFVSDHHPSLKNCFTRVLELA